MLVIDACNIYAIETINVLMVEGCAIYATMINEAIQHDGRLICDVTHARAAGCRHAVKTAPSISTSFCSIYVCRTSHGLDTSQLCRQAASDRPIRVIPALEDETVAVDAVQAGAQKYLSKGPGRDPFPAAQHPLRD
jgi:ActR/RegA family two-component response regulator